MTMEMGVPELKATEPIKIEDIQAQKAALKNLAFQEIDGLPGEQSQILLEDIRTLEMFLNSTIYPKDKIFDKSAKKAKRPLYQIAHSRTSSDSSRKKPSGKKYFGEELKFVVGGMINIMTSERVRQIYKNPKDFINLLHGKPYEVPHIIDRPPMIVEKQKPEPVKIEIPKVPSIEQEIEDPEAQLKRAIEANDENLKRIIVTARALWHELSLDSFPAIKELFKASGVEVEIEFFQPNNEHYGEDFIIVSYKDGEVKKGIVVPKNGTNLDRVAVAELFSGWKPDVKVTVDNLLEFPEAIRKEFYQGIGKGFKLEWRLTEYGKLKNKTYE